MKTRKDIELERILANDMANVRLSDELLLIREGEAVLGVILTSDLRMSVVEAEMMLEPFIKGERKEK